MGNVTPRTESRSCSGGCGRRMRVRFGQAADPLCRGCRGPAKSVESACVSCGKSLWVRVAQDADPKCLSCRDATVEHGKPSTYAHRGCRCDECRAGWSAKHNEYQKRVRRDKGLLKVKSCVICQANFNPHGQQVTCSPECRRTYSGKIGDHRSRAAYYGGEFQKVDRLEVFERDGWLCGICCKPVDRTLLYPDRRSASLDHVIPLSRGGSHALGNVQCSHLDCNRQKGYR